MDVELRPATDTDRVFCFALHEAAMREYVAAIWGWHDATQREFFDQSWNPSITRIIMRHGQDIGMLKLVEQVDTVYIARIEIHPDHQGGGIGGLLVSEIIADAERCGRAVELDVLNVNARAQALYRRFGFVEQFRHGDDNVKIRMRRKPAIWA